MSLSAINENLYRLAREGDGKSCIDNTVEYFNPETKKFTKLTKETLKSVSDKYYDKEFEPDVEKADKDTPSEEAHEEEEGHQPQEGGPGNPPPPPSVELDYYGRYTKVEWE